MNLSAARLTKGGIDIALVPHDAGAVAGFLQRTLGLLPGPEAPAPGGRRVLFGAGVSAIKLIDLDAPPPAVPGEVLDIVGFRVVRVPVETVPDAALIADPDGTWYRQVPLLDGGTCGVEVVAEAPGELASFYRAAFGLVDTPAGALRWGSSEVVFSQALPEARRTPEGRAGAAGIRYLTALVEDMDVVHAAAIACGAREIVAPNDFAGTVRFSIVADPDGNWIELGTLLRS